MKKYSRYETFTPIPRKGNRSDYGRYELRKEGIELFLDFINVKGERFEKVKIK